MSFGLCVTQERQASLRAAPVVLAAVCTVAFGLASSRASGGDSQRPNAILITVDTLRADRLGSYGNPSGLTPAMDGLARDGVVFRRAVAQVPLTLPSHTAILTGTYPMWNGVEDLSTRGLSPGIPTLAEAFKRHGYATAAFVSAFVLDSMWGLERGFDLYDDWFKPVEGKADRRDSLERRAEETVNHSLAWLDAHHSQSFFLWIHLYDPHAPYDPPEPFKSRYRARPYDGEVAYADQQLGRLIASLKRAGLYAPALIVLTSDHGESLGEHQEQQHGFFIYNSTVRVPLIVKPPDGFEPARRSVVRVVNTVDIAPTLAQFCRFDSSDVANFQGRSLLALLDKSPPTPTREGYSESLYPRSTFGWHSLRAVETGQYHYIAAPKEELYDLEQDPGETHNLVRQSPATVAALRAILQQAVTRFGRKAGVSASAPALGPEAVEKLRSLGYLSISLPKNQQDDDPRAADPKDEIGFYNQVMRATELAEDGRFRESNALLEQTAAANPRAYLLPFLQGENSLALGQPREAVRYYRRALGLNAGFDQAAMGLGHAAYRAGDNAEAVKAYQLALELNPRNFIVRLALGKAYWRLNRLDDAAEGERQVLREHPNYAQARADYGITLVRLRKFDIALPELLKAIELGYRTSLVYNYLGNAYMASGRSAEAVGAYEEAIRLDPNSPTAYVKLAVIFAQSGQPEKARQYYQKACRLDPQLCRQIGAKFR